LQTVAELGLVVFNALDYGLKEEEERQLSPALENLIDIMTAVGTYLYEY
jgi:spire-like protein